MVTIWHGCSAEVFIYLVSALPLLKIFVFVISVLALVKFQFEKVKPHL